MRLELTDSIGSPLVSLPPSGSRWASWTGFVIGSSWDLGEWVLLVDKQWQQCLLMDSVLCWDLIAELNMGCIYHFFSRISRREIRHTGHVEFCCSHMSIHVAWKEWPQTGRIRNVSSSRYSARHTVHLWRDILQSEWWLRK